MESCELCGRSQLQIDLTIRVFHHRGELLDLFARRFHVPPALKIGLPLRGLCQRSLAIFVQCLSHDRNQIANDSCVLEQRFDDRMREFSRREIVWFAKCIGLMDFLILHRVLVESSGRLQNREQ